MVRCHAGEHAGRCPLVGIPADKRHTPLLPGNVGVCLIRYNKRMIQLKRTTTFARWMRSLADRHAKTRIILRLERLMLGNQGDAKSVGTRVFELRIHYGPGYRVYYTRRGNTVILLLCGGDKSTQQADIKQAQELAQNWTDDDEND